MMITRKQLLRSAGAFALAGAAGVLAPGAGGAQAQDYPSQDIHVICGFPPGSGADILVRFFAEKLRLVAGRAVIVENKVGAAGNIATEYVARSKPDGYTLYIFAGTTVAATMHLFKNPPVDVSKTIRAVATTNNMGFVLSVDAKSPYKSLAELTAAMKQKGEKASYAVAANPAIIMGAIYKRAAGLQAVDVQYRTSGDALNDILSGRIDYGLSDGTSALAQQRQGRLRILAVSTSERLKAAPDIPTMKESGIPMDLDLWWGVMVAADTPKPIVDKINQWFSQIVASEETRKFLALSGADPLIRTAEQAQAMFLKAIEEWGEYVKIANIPKN